MCIQGKIIIIIKLQQKVKMLAEKKTLKKKKLHKKKKTKCNFDI